MTKSSPVIQIDNVSYRISAQESLEKISFSIAANSIHAIVGPNGAGKTTLLRIIAGELDIHKGTIYSSGIDISNLSVESRAEVLAYAGYCPPISFPYTSMELCQIGASDASHEIILEVMKIMQVDYYSEKYVSMLSTGELQRLIVARALIQIWEQSDQRLIILDEPTANLDPSHQHSTMEALENARDRGISVLMVTHDLNLALQYTDSVTLMKSGTILGSGETKRTMTSDLMSQLFDIRITVTNNKDLPHPIAIVN